MSWCVSHDGIVNLFDKYRLMENLYITLFSFVLAAYMVLLPLDRYIIMALGELVCYMALVVKTDLPIINSILLMLIALICVGMGFYGKEKGIRIARDR